MIVGIIVVLGACVSLWWHHQRFKTLQSSETAEHALAFAQKQYSRRSITTTLIGVLGLLIVATEISPSKWADLVILLLLGSVLLVIPVMALIDFQATQRYFRTHDQGVRRATQDLVEELRRIELRLKEKKQDEAAESEPPASGNEPSEGRDHSAGK